MGNALPWWNFAAGMHLITTHMTERVLCIEPSQLKRIRVKDQQDHF